MHEARPGIGVDEHLHAAQYLLVAGRCEGAHHDAHGPHHVIAHVGPADALAGLSAEEVGVVVAEHEAPRVLVDGVVDADVAQVGHGQQRRHVGVVHEVVVAEAVYLEGVDGAVLRVLVHGVLAERLLHLVGQRAAVARQLCVAVHACQYVCGLAQRRYGEEVRGHQIEEDGGVVAGAEGRADESAGLGGVAVSAVAHGVVLCRRGALEAVGPVAVLALLLAEGLQDGLHGVEPQLTLEDAVVARHQPVLVGQPQGVAERVNLILALVQEGLHVGVVGGPLAARRAVVEGVGVGVEDDALQLSQDGAAHHAAHFLVVLGKLHVGPHLCAAVAQPHGVYVAGVDEGVVIAVVGGAVVHGGVEGVGEAVAEHPGQVGGLLQQALHLGYLLLNALSHEEACRLGGAAADARGGCRCLYLLGKRRRLLVVRQDRSAWHGQCQAQDHGIKVFHWLYIISNE